MLLRWNGTQLTTLKRCLALVIAKYVNKLTCKDGKRERNVAIFQLKRWMEIIDHYNEWGSQLELGEDFIRRFLEVLHLESIEIQQRVMNQDLDTSESSV